MSVCFPGNSSPALPHGSSVDGLHVSDKYFMLCSDDVHSVKVQIEGKEGN